MRETAPPIIAPTTRGFSLIELSVVVLIIGILIYMTLAAGREQLEIARIKQTQYKLQKIQTALAVYLKTFGYLPCPADGTAAINSATFGAQSRNSANSMADSVLTDSSCSANLVDFVPVVYIGVVPVTTLGMSPESMFDGWGNRITYIVSIPCIDPDNWVSSSRFKCVDTSGGNQIDGDYITLSGTNGQSWPANAAYMTISYGRSGNGAWSRTGTRNGINVASTAPAELTNGNINASGASLSAGFANSGYYDQPINDGDIKSNYYDNITAWATAPQLYYFSNH